MSDENDVKESAVEVRIPNDDEVVTEVKLDKSDKSEVVESNPKAEIRAKEKERDPAPAEPDEREKALEDLRKQYEHQRRVAEAEREARKRAEMFAREQAQTVQHAQTDVQASHLRVIQNAIDSTETAAAAAERDYADAMAAGDYAAAAKAQRQISQAEAHLLQLQNGKARLEETLQPISEGRVEAPRIPDFTPQLPQDPVETYAERLTPKSAAWLRAHPQVVEKVGKLTRAHQDAVEDGIAPESPEYFEFIENRLGISSRQSEISEEQPRESARQAPTPRKQMASAPVTNSGSPVSGRGGANGNTMTLSAAEVEMAILNEPTLPRDKAIEAYARSKMELIRAGKLSA